MRITTILFLLAPLTLCADIQRPDTDTLRASAPPRENAPTDWTPAPFTHYDVILSRKPFGNPPPPPPSAAALAAAAPPPPPPFATKLTLCGFAGQKDILVGFTDGSANPAHSYCLGIGEVQDGFTVVTANPHEETATISKDGVSVDLKLGKGSTPTAPAAPSPVVAAQAASTLIAPPQRNTAAETAPPSPQPFDATNWPIPGNVKAIEKALALGIKQESYVERLKKRREELLADRSGQDTTNVKADSVNDERITARFEAILRKKNLDMIRSGAGGLGIPLTAEEDAQLVTEGALPARN